MTAWESPSAIVTGGASGLGRATADMLRSRNVHVVVLDLPEAVQHVGASDGLTLVPGDVLDSDAVSNAVDAASQLGPLRMCVNAAGIGPPARVLKGGQPLPLEKFTRIVDVNLVGTFNVVRLAAAQMQHNERLHGERGVIVNTASVAAFEGQIGQAAYAASKGGLAAMTIALARDLADSLIRCITIAPGLFETPILDVLPDKARQSLADAVPHPHRLGVPDEYAALVGHIIENQMLNGEVIRLDGALRLAPR